MSAGEGLVGIRIMSAALTAAAVAVIVKEGGVSIRSTSYFCPGTSAVPPKRLRAFVADP
jgi:hypothetical protein